LYQTYISVNQKIAKGMFDLVKEKDDGQLYRDIQSGKVNLKIWVHDYHLFPLPSFLRNYFPHAKIGFYLHIPFPSYDFFKLLPRIKKIIRYLLSADLIGFHTEYYKNNFLGFLEEMNKKCKDNKFINIENKNILALPIRSNYKTFSQFHTKEMFNIHHHIRKLEDYGQLSKFQIPKDHKEEIFVSSNVKTILGVDRSDTIKGLLQKLDMFERLLELYPECIGKVELVQVIIPSRLKVSAVKTMMKKLEEKVFYLNKKYTTNGEKPVRIINNCVSGEVLKALYNQSDCLIVSSLRDGMNLVALEYLEAQTVENPGVLMISKFAGVYEFVKNAAIGINPWDKDKCAEKLYSAINMNAKEKANLYSNIASYIKNENTEAWARDFISLLGIKPN
jgi:trehalose 6-phosphate synthase/phosphatase